MNETYQEWYKYIRNIVIYKVLAVEVEFEIKIRAWSTQWPKNLLYLIKKLEFDK